MTKKIESEKKKLKLNTIIKIVLVVLAIVFFWVVYSLFRFDGIYSPIYVYGISNPYKYWQEHIGLLLIENGKQYDLKLSIDESDSETYSIYKNEEHNFEFKYPRGFLVEGDDSSDDTVTSIKVFKNENNLGEALCYITAQHTWRGGSKDWLPARRLFIENYVKKGNFIFYLLTKQGQIIHTNSSGHPNHNGAQICYINRTKDQIIDFSIGGQECPYNLLGDIILTFQFIQ